MILFSFWILIGLGILAASLALYGRYRILPAIFTGPRTCRLKAGGCQALFRTSSAALLGVPNSLLALFYYFLLGIGVTFQWPAWPLFAASSLALIMSFYLMGVLIRGKLECRICWVGHLCNTGLWLLSGYLAFFAK